MSKKQSANAFDKKQISLINDTFKTAPKIITTIIISGLFLTLLFTIIAYNTPSPMKISEIFPFVALYCSSFVGGAVSSKLLRPPHSYFCATIATVFFILILLFLKLITARYLISTSTTSTVAQYFFIMISAITGAVVSDFLSKKHNTKHKRRRR